jgi:hypothetical protein
MIIALSINAVDRPWMSSYLSRFSVAQRESIDTAKKNKNLFQAKDPAILSKYLRYFILSVCESREDMARELFDLASKVTSATGDQVGLEFEVSGGVPKLTKVVDLHAASLLFAAATLCVMRRGRLSRVDHDDLTLSSILYRETGAIPVNVPGFGTVKSPWGINWDISHDAEYRNEKKEVPASGPMQRHLINVKSALQRMKSFAGDADTLHLLLPSLPWYTSVWLTTFATRRVWDARKNYRISATVDRTLKPSDQELMKGYIGDKWGWKVLAGQMQAFKLTNFFSRRILKNSPKTFFDAFVGSWNKMSESYMNVDSAAQWMQRGPSRAYVYKNRFSSALPKVATDLLSDYFTPGPVLLNSWPIIGQHIDESEAVFNNKNFKTPMIMSDVVETPRADAPVGVTVAKPSPFDSLWNTVGDMSPVVLAGRLAPLLSSAVSSVTYVESYFYEVFFGTRNN